MLLRTRIEMTRRGLTLIELIVVMAILVALASILIPLFPNMLRRAHKASDCTNSSEVNKSVQLYQSSFYGYPDNFDLLLDSTGAFPTYLPWDHGVSNTAPFGGFVTPGTLTATQIGYLQNAGINFVQPLAPSSATTTPPANWPSFHVTMSPYADTYAANKTQLTPTVKVAILSYAGIQAQNPNFLDSEFNTDPPTDNGGTAVYVVFGVGSRNTMVGQTMQDAPISVSQKKTFTPDNTYSRVGVIFKVDGVEVQKSERARFIAAVALEDDELESTEKDAVGYYGVSTTP